MSADGVIVVSTGVANLASIMAGLRRAGGDPSPAADAREVERAGHVVLPGVGAFGAGMDRLRSEGLDRALRARLEAGRSTLAVCLGLQLLCEQSDESPGVKGLGVLPASVERFPDGVRVPHFGWNRVEPSAGCRLLRAGYAYFANSYRLRRAPAGWAVATTEYAGPFVAALERGSLLACQFHPELSGDFGLDLLERWLGHDATGRRRC